MITLEHLNNLLFSQFMDRVLSINFGRMSPFCLIPAFLRIDSWASLEDGSKFCLLQVTLFQATLWF